MRNRLLLLVAILLQCVSLQACASQSKSPQSAGRRVDIGEEWKIRYAVTGGIAGTLDRMEIDNTGRITARDLRMKREATGQASPELLAEIRSALKTATEAPPVKPGPPMPDSIDVSVTVVVAGREVEIAVPKTLIEHLRQTFAQQLSGARTSSQ